MNRWIVSTFALVSSVARAENQPFDSFYLLSESNFAASQYYQVQNRDCEIATVSARGNGTYKKIDLVVEVKAQGGAFQCLQTLESKSLVIGMRMDSVQFAADGVIFRQESFSTEAAPSFTFNVSPWFSLGMQLNFQNQEIKTEDARYSANGHNSVASASVHQDNWEITLAHADRYRNYEFPDLDIPRETTVFARARPGNGVTVGARMNRIDYPGVVTGDNNRVQSEVNTGLIVGAQVMDMYLGELSYTIQSSVSGNPDIEGHTITGLLGVTFDHSIKIGATVNLVETTSNLVDSSQTIYGFIVGYAQ